MQLRHSSLTHAVSAQDATTRQQACDDECTGGALCSHRLEQLEGRHAPQDVVAKQLLTEHFFIQGFIDVFGGVGGGLAELGEEGQRAQADDAAEGGGRAEIGGRCS
jgi:hypothetical protein